MATGLSAPTAIGSARAGFWRRFAAAVIDALIVGIVGGIIGAILHSAPSASYVVGTIIGIAYYTYFEGGPQGAGPGKRVMNIRVVDVNTGGAIGYPRAFVRYIGRIVSTIPIFLGYFWMLWDGQKQCWHDKFASDVVVPTTGY
ncbi:MAG: RDD family protein [Solirubrobacterales bacterium]|nr:RDD family protein [Solirubrobacterales bacterium]